MSGFERARKIDVVDASPRSIFFAAYQRISESIRTSAISIGAAVLTLFGSYDPVLAQDVQAQDAIQKLIEQYEREEFKTRPPSTQSDAIANMLQRSEAVGAQEFLERNYLKTNMDMPLIDQPHIMSCLIHNAFREARGKKDLAEGGPEMVALISIARAVDPQGRFPRNDVCEVVKQAKQFSWTFDRRILTQFPSEAEHKEFIKMKQRLEKEVGTMNPREFLQHVVRKLNLTEDSLFYHHEKMWGEDEQGNVIYGKRPVRADYVSEEQYRRHMQHYKMSPRTARFFAGLIRVTPEGKSIGSHIVLRAKRSTDRQ